MNNKLYIVLNESYEHTKIKLTLREAVALKKQLPGESCLYKYCDWNSEMELDKLEKEKNKLPSLGPIMNEDK